MKKNSIKTRATSLLQRTAKVSIAFVAFFGFSIMNIPVLKTSAVTPSGPTKRVIVQYSQAAQVLGANTESTIQSTMSGYVRQEPYRFKHLPFGIYEVDQQGEQSLDNSNLVDGVFENSFYKATSNLPLPAIGANPANNAFSDTNTVTAYDGTGYAVAIMDTGVDKDHTLLSGKVVNEACFGTNYTYINATLTSDCPGAADYVLNSTGSAAPCDATADIGCGHGTHVAGIAAMNSTSLDIDDDTTPDLLSGVAVGADIIALKVFTNVNSATICAGEPTYPDCQRTTTEDQLEAIDYLLDLSASTNIAAVNMSIGGSPYASSYNECEANESSVGEYQAMRTAFAALRNARIAPVVSNGNDGETSGNENKISSPACVEGAVAIGATNTIGDTIASYSNNGPLTTLLAPGGDATEVLQGTPGDGSDDTLDSLMWSSFPAYNGCPVASFAPTTYCSVFPSYSGTDGSHATSSEIVGEQGTSMAAPVVAGAFAVLRDKHPNATVDQLTALLQTTGTDVTDARSGYTVGAKKLIDLTAALSSVTLPAISSFTGPSGTVNEGSTIDLTLTSTNASTCSMNNGIGALSEVNGTFSVTAYSSITVTCTGSYGDTVQSTFTPASFNSAPTKPNGSTALTVVKDSTARTASISWSASTDTDGIANYLVTLDGVAQSTTTQTSYSFSDLSLSHDYAVTVRAVDTLGAISQSSDVTIRLDSVATPDVPSTGLKNIFNAMGMNTSISLGAVLSTGLFVYFGKRRFF